MIKKDFNANWFFHKVGEQSHRLPVHLPHDAMIFEKRTEDNFSSQSGAYFEGCDYVYEKNFELTADLAESKIVFEFEGVYRNAEVFINEVKVAYRPYGYTNFYVDATNFLNISGNNSIRVTATNSDQPNCRWYSGAGIYRPVSMLILPKKHIEINGIKIKTISFEPPIIEVAAKTNGSGQLKIEILDNGTAVHCKTIAIDCEAVTQIMLSNAKLWSCDSPNLYTCRASYCDDVVMQSFGICKIEVSAAEGLKINGTRTILRGACLHHDNGLIGAVSHPFAEQRKVKLMKECGFNAVRCAHNPCSKAFLDACDSLGIYVIDEYVDTWFMHKSKYDYADYIMDWWKSDLADMSDKDFNHPSVIMYSVGNEVCESAKEKGIEFCAEMVKFLSECDYRPVTCGINIFFNYLSTLGFGVYSDKKAEKSAKVKKSKAVGSEFFNNLAGILGRDFMKFGATLNGSDRTTREVFSKLDVAGYNYGIRRYKKDVKKYPSRVIMGTETFCADAYKFYEFAKSNPAVIGDFIWSGMDYIGEVGIGAWEYADNAPISQHGVGWITAGSGRYDITGKANAEVAYIKVAYDLSPLEMAVASPAHYSKKHSPSAWKMSNLLDSWSFNGFDGIRTKVEVFTKAYMVEIYVNDKLIGAKKRNKNNCCIIFKTKYFGGKILAKAYDENKVLIAEKMLKTAEDNVKIYLESENNQISLSDLAYVRIKICDNNGTVSPLQKSEVKVSVTGGQLIGLGNGCSYNKYGYKTDQTITYFGEALAIIKPLEVGLMTITAKSNYGLAQIEATIV